MRDNDEIHEAVKREACDPETGGCGHGCSEPYGCTAYDSCYDDIKKEWELE